MSASQAPEASVPPPRRETAVSGKVAGSSRATETGGIAHRETKLTGGVRIAVTVEAETTGPDDVERMCSVALRGAADAIARTAEPPPLPPVHATGIIGRSPEIAELLRMMARVAASDATVLVIGENGTGKELVARALHQISRRANKRFVATNCSAFNDNLLESELFGHRRGAFTGAIVDKPGLFEVADGGTFFLDEVGDMSPALQVKLLRVLQEGTFMPVGGTEMRKVDVRIVAATNRDLAGMVKSGSFREDVFYRLNVVTLRVPALRERAGDIRILCDHFLARLAEREGRRKRLSDACLSRLESHRWPGNVRELENEIERLWVLSGEGALIDEDLLSDAIRMSSVAPSAGPTTKSSPSPAPLSLYAMKLPDAVETLERQMIDDGLSRARGNKTRAARELGISRRNLIRKVQALSLDAGTEDDD